MGRIAVISDIHSNLEALQTVLDDIDENGCTAIHCLGDIIGYGPNPRQVLRIAMERFSFALRGNHEEGVLTRPVDFNWKAEASALWTKDQLRSRLYSERENRRFWSYLESLPQMAQTGDTIYVHGSPLDPIREYLLPEMCANSTIMNRVFSKIRRLAFGGHTHVPGIFSPTRGFLDQHQLDGPFPVEKGKFFVNVGSVGQPRDGDPRASYVIYDGKTVLFRRLSYNFRKTLRKIRHIRRLPNALGTRLMLGL